MQLLIDQALGAYELPRCVQVRGTLDPALPLAVVSQAPRLQNAGRAELLRRAREIVRRVDGGMFGDRNLQAPEQRLLVQPVLGNLERRARRTDGGQLRERCERLAGDVLPVEGEHVAEHGELFEERGVLERPEQTRRDLGTRRVRVSIEERAVEAQWIACERQHAPELSRSHDANVR